MTDRDGTAVLVFAKAPRPGAVKTRLIPRLGEEGAATLHVKLVEHALEMARAGSFGRVELHCDPDADDPYFRFCAARYGVALRPQGPGDLGARMLAAFERALAAHARVLLIGSDCAALTPSYLREADRALRDGAETVLAPCEDGGYALIGLRRFDPRLFEDIAWGGRNVMTATRARLAGLGWRWLELGTLWDVDRPEDYDRLAQSGLLGAQRRTMTE